jgi:hydroxymethylpyrimidine/phosphomethylpyrimidine kinase
LPISGGTDTMDEMAEQELMTAADIHAFGIEIVCKQLIKDGWSIDSADVEANIMVHPQIIAVKDGELAFFVVRTAMYPGRGRFDEGQEVFDRLVQHAHAHGASCYFASVGLANSTGGSDAEMSVPAKGVAYHVQFEGLIKMELQSEVGNEEGG